MGFLSKAFKKITRGTAAVLTGGLSEKRLKDQRESDRNFAGHQETQAQKIDRLNKFAGGLRNKAFRTPEAGRLSGEAITGRKNQEQLAQEAAQNSISSRQQQQDLIQQLQNRATGQSASQAQRDVNNAAARQKAQVQAQLASRAGFGAGSNARAAARAAAGIQRQTAQQQEQLKAQESVQGQQQLANALSQARQQDVQAQQQAQTGQLQSQQQEQRLQESEQQSAANAASAAINRSLAEQGTQLQETIARTQQQNARSGALGSAIGAGVGAYFGGPVGAQIGSQAGGFATFNKGGKVPKLNKEQMFGYKKAKEAEKNNSNRMSQGAVVNTPEKIDVSRPATIEAAIEASSKSKGIDDRQKVAKEQSKKLAELAEQNTANQRQTRQQQASLAQQLADRQSGATPSLTSINTKAASNKSLAQQLAAQGRARKTATAAQIANAAQNTSPQLISNAAASGLQEQNQLAGTIQQNASQTRALDINQQNFANQMALRQLAQEEAVRESERALGQQRASLDIRETAAVNALNAQAAAAPKRKKFLGIFNEGGKVPGKPRVKGDNIKNDIVPALLSPGEIVIPRTVVNKGEDAMLGFIKGLESKMKKNKKSKYYKGGKVKKEELEAEKEGSGVSSEVATGLAAAGQLAGNVKRSKLKEKEDKREREKRKFDRALSEIKGMSKYSKGGKVSKTSPCFGDVIKAKKNLSNKKRK